jgi:hypothetical protein
MRDNQYLGIHRFNDTVKKGTAILNGSREYVCWHHLLNKRAFPIIWETLALIPGNAIFMRNKGHVASDRDPG